MSKHKKYISQALKNVLMYLFISGCTMESPTVDQNNKEKSNIQCIDGVEYILYRDSAGYQGHGFMSVKFNSDSTVSTCRK